MFNGRRKGGVPEVEVVQNRQFIATHPSTEPTKDGTRFSDSRIQSVTLASFFSLWALSSLMLPRSLRLQNCKSLSCTILSAALI